MHVRKKPAIHGLGTCAAARAIKTANPRRSVIFMDVLHGIWGSLGEPYIDPGPRLGIRSVLNDSIPWLTSAAGLLKRSDAPDAIVMVQGISRSRCC